MTSFISTLNIGELAVLTRGVNLSLSLSISTRSTPSSELTETNILFAIDAISDKYLTPFTRIFSPLNLAIVIGFSGS